MLSKNKRILYISYNGMLDPLGQSQVIPYLKELAKCGMRFSLLSYERAAAFRADGVERRRTLQDELATHGIEWHVLRYHQRPSLPATAFDVAAGIRLASRLVRRHDIELVHARAHIPAVIALAMKRRFGTKIIFDVRGLMAEEYIDAEHWRAKGAAARITKTMEARVLRSTDGIVTLTDALWNEMQNWQSVRARSVIHETVPCCIDLKKFRFNESQRATRREELGVANRFVLAYSGSIGGWYNTDEMSEFFAVLKQRRPDAFFLWLTQGRPEIVTGAMNKCGVSDNDYVIRNVAPRDVPSFLSAADAGIAFYRPGISRLGTSPVKVSEYLACGLPVVINAGIGDCDRLFAQREVGAIVKAFNEAGYQEAGAELDSLIDNAAATRARTKKAAEDWFDLNQVGAMRYTRLYNNVMSEPE
jgi:glycosyltransferase involved in cell wall biosynthesis